MVSLTEIIAVLGFVTGLPSLAILMYKTLKEKPRLIITVENAYWYIHTPEDQFFNIIAIPIRIDNKGERGTTIHSTNISFMYNGKPLDVKDDRPLSLEIPPNGTVRFYLSYNLKRSEIKLEGTITDARLTINYTHKSKQIIIPVLKPN